MHAATPFPATHPPAQRDDLSLADGEIRAPQHAALRRLSALLTHRLSTLTSTISGYAELLVDTPTPQEQRRMAMNVLETSSEIDDLLQDLRYFSNPVQPALRTIAVPDIVERTMTLLSADEQSRTRFEVDDVASTLRADPQMLRQALLSLLQNALEATAPDGMVRLRVVADVTSEEGNSATRFEVWNEGSIPLKRPTDIFRPFFTTHARRLGLGLSIVRRIAESHGGTLQLAANDVSKGGTCLALQI